MVNCNSKVALVAGALAILIATGVCFILREPSLQPPKTLSEIPKIVKNASPSSSPPPAPELHLRSESPVFFGSSSRFEQVPQQDQDIIFKLEQQGVSRQNARRLEREDRPIPQDVIDYLSHALNWMPELEKAASTIISRKSGDPSMLRLYNIHEDSILRRLGLEDGDIVALIDGQIPLFNRNRVLEYTQMAWRFINTLDKGDPISMTVLREGKPIQLVYRRW